MKTLKKAYMSRHYISKGDDDYYLDRISVPINDVIVDYTEIADGLKRKMKKEAGLKMKDVIFRIRYDEEDYDYINIDVLINVRDEEKAISDVIFKISHDEEDSEYINIDLMINAREEEKAISDVKVFYNTILIYIRCYFISNDIEVI